MFFNLGLYLCCLSYREGEGKGEGEGERERERERGRGRGRGGERERERGRGRGRERIKCKHVFGNILIHACTCTQPHMFTLTCDWFVLSSFS